jgi:cytochrome c553
MSSKEQILEDIETLSEAEIKELAEYLAFLKYRSQSKSHVVDESQLAALYAEFAEEDRNLAEEGIANYTEGLREEDAG